MDAKKVGKKIAELRKKNNMTQKELASKLNVIDKTVSRWECGYGLPDLSIIPEIAAIFNTSIEELLGTNVDIPSDVAAETVKDEAEEIKTAWFVKYKRHLIFGGSAAAMIICVAILIIFLIQPKIPLIDGYCWDRAGRSEADYVFITAFGTEECMSLELTGDESEGEFFCQETWKLGANQDPINCAVYGKYKIKEGKIHLYSEKLIDDSATNKLRLHTNLGLEAFVGNVEYSDDGNISGIAFKSTVKNTESSVFGRWTKYDHYFSREKGEIYFERVSKELSYEQILKMPTFVAVEMGVVVPYRLEAYLTRYDYYVGEIINRDDIEVSLVYSDGTKNPIDDFTCEQVGRELTTADTSLNVHYSSDETKTTAIIYVNVKYGLAWERIRSSNADYKYFTHYNIDDTISFGILELFGDNNKGNFIYSENYGTTTLDDASVVTGKYHVRNGEIHFISSKVFTNRNHLPKFYVNSEGDYFTAIMGEDMSDIVFHTGQFERNLFGHYVTEQNGTSFSDTVGTVCFEPIKEKELSDRAKEALEHYKSMYK